MRARMLNLLVLLTVALAACGDGEGKADEPAADQVAAAIQTTAAGAGTPTLRVETTTPTRTRKPTRKPTRRPTAEATADDDETTPSGGGTQRRVRKGTYKVTISGTAGSTAFRRTGTVKILATISATGTGNGVNQVDVCLVSGFPAGQPEAGAILYGSNSACAPGAGRAELDLAYVTVNGNQVTVKPDSSIAATLGNNFTVRGGLTACIYAPTSGRMTLTTSSSGDISGDIDVVGYGGAGCGQTRFQADIDG